MKTKKHNRISIAVIGNDFSGKSTYVAMVINDLRRSLWKSFRCILAYDADLTEQEIYEDNYAVYLKENCMLPADCWFHCFSFPLIFVDTKDVIELVIYDISNYVFGRESYVKDQELLKDINAFIWMINPLQFDKITQVYKGENHCPTDDENEIILHNISSGLRKYRNLNGKIKLPLAIALTKTDELEKNCDMEDFTSPICYGDGAVLHEKIVLAEKQIRDFFDFVSYDIDSLICDFSKVRMFGLSSIELEKKDGNKILYKNSKSTLNPIYWILSEYQIINTNK